MKGTVKWFSMDKGYGFITDNTEGKDYFVHQSSIQMDGFRFLNTNDIVDFEIGKGTTGKEQAVNVVPILTKKMVEDSLKEDNLHLEIMKDPYGVKKYLVVNTENVLQTDEQGMSLLEVASYAGINVEEKENMEDSKMSKDFKENYVATVKTVTQESEESILSNYKEACDNFKKLTPDARKVLEECKINLDEPIDFPTVLTTLKNQWNMFDSTKKQTICATIAGVRSALNVMTYLEAKYLSHSRCASPTLYTDYQMGSKIV